MRRSLKDAVELVVKLVAHWALAWFAYQIFPYQTMWLFIIPYIVTTGLLMFGNFSQHIFVDPERFDDNYLLTFNVIGKGSLNEKIFNDGYHIVHHANSKLSWDKMADEFAENWREYDK